MTEEETLEKLVKDMLQANSTFSEEMIAKVREELLKAGRDAKTFYENKAET